VQEQINNLVKQALEKQISERPMDNEEKNKLRLTIQQLNPDYQRGIIDLLRDIINPSNQDCFEFELDQIPVRKCRQLETYARLCLQQTQKKEKRKIADQARRQLQKANQSKHYSDQPLP
jgi:hypothetical protein